MSRNAHDQLEWDFTNHAPVDESVVEMFEHLREFAKAFGHVILDVCPDSQERHEALIHLRQSLMWAVGAVACNQGELGDLDVRIGALRERIQDYIAKEL